MQHNTNDKAPSRAATNAPSPPISHIGEKKSAKGEYEGGGMGGGGWEERKQRAAPRREPK